VNGERAGGAVEKAATGEKEWGIGVQFFRWRSREKSRPVRLIHRPRKCAYGWMDERFQNRAYHVPASTVYGEK
jgi:hypothetical protein